MLDHAAGSGQHTYAERAQDCYETPPEAVHALLKVEKLPNCVWEPACGPGSISNVLAGYGYTVVATDLHDYGQAIHGVDFLSEKRTPWRPSFAHCIVTNPPYQLAQQFVEKAISLSPKVIMLMRLQFLESVRRAHILDRGSGLARIHVFANRLPMIHRKGWVGPKASSAIAFCWMVWERGYDGLATIDRVTWESLK